MANRRRGAITTDCTVIKGNIVNNFISINLITYEMNKFLERHKLAKLTQEEIGNLNSPTHIKETDFFV